MLTSEQKAALAAEKPSPRQWRVMFELPPAQRIWFNDEEASRYSGVTERTLRTFQAKGFIEASKAPVGDVGFRRIWRKDVVQFAAVAGELIRVLGWSAPRSAEILKFSKVSSATESRLGLQPLIIDSMEQAEDFSYMAPEHTVVRREQEDWFAIIHDGKFVFLEVPISAMHYYGAKYTIFPIAVISEEINVPVIFQLEDENFFDQIASDLGKKEAKRQREEVMFIRRAAENSFVRTTVNLSMPIRAAARRIQGLDVQRLDEIAMRLLIGNWRDSQKVEE